LWFALSAGVVENTNRVTGCDPPEPAMFLPTRERK
jgi:hypothetical protein